MPSFTILFSLENNVKEIGNFLKNVIFDFDFLPPRKPGLYISRVDFFFFEYHEF